MGETIGIDLGTTNSRAAYFDGNRADVLASAEQERFTPSVIARGKEGTVLVGRTAVDYAARDPENAVFSITRLLGRRYGDAYVDRLKKRVSFRIVPGQGDQADLACVALGENIHSPVEVTALILEKIKDDAERALGRCVTDAVITVPVYADYQQREATRQAGVLAGLNVQQLLDAPTAAAWASAGSLDPDTARTVLVYDLGGGTFNVSVISMANGISTVANTEGDPWLGGDDFDNAIVEHVIDRVESENAGIGEAMRADPKLMWSLKQHAEQAKKRLSLAPSADVVMLGELRGKLDVHVTVRRADFEQWIGPDIERSISLLDRALAVPTLTPADVDRVLLVGGSTAIPLVRRMLIEKLGEEKIVAGIDAMACVAQGAAIVASRTDKKVCIQVLDRLFQAEPRDVALRTEKEVCIQGHENERDVLSAYRARPSIGIRTESADADKIKKLRYLFSAFYPEKVGSQDIGKIIAYAHLEAIAQEVAREAARRLHLPSGAPIRAASVSKAVPRESVIKVTPDVPGLAFENAEATMALWEDKQSVEFRFKAAPSAAGQVCRGWVHYWLEGLALADVPVAIFVAEKETPDIFQEALASANARPYRTVFPSYSRRDSEIVERLETYAAAFGDEYLRDVHRLRAGQRFSDELVRFIKRADVFQLFWSENAASSEWVQFEWRQALRERDERPDPYFLRPVYWTPEPAPIPDELKELHFAKVPL